MFDSSPRLALVLLAGCWTGPVPEAAVDSTAPKPIDTSPYAAVAGEWRGIGQQYDNMSTWPFTMTLRTGAAIGEVVGTIAYPSLHCTSDLIREPEERGMLVMTERLTSGAGLCVDAGVVRFARRPRGGKLDWRWFTPDGAEGAKSIMRRTK